jgi:hypothetical protein
MGKDGRCGVLSDSRGHDVYHNMGTRGAYDWWRSFGCIGSLNW